MSNLSFDLAGDLGGSAEPAADDLPQIDHVALGLARLPWQWRDSGNMIALFAIFLARFNVLEQVCQRLLLLRSIETANADDPFGVIGAQLDQIGAKVGQQRNGLNNNDYRRYIRARIGANNSNGLVEDLIKVAALVINDPAVYVQVQTVGPAAVNVGIWNISTDDTLARVLIDFLRVAVAGGVRLLLLSTPTTPASTFVFGSGPGFGAAADAGQPTMHPYDPTGTGGLLANVRE